MGKWLRRAVGEHGDTVSAMVVVNLLIGLELRSCPLCGGFSIVWRYSWSRWKTCLVSCQENLELVAPT